MKPGWRENTAGADTGTEGFTSHSTVTRTSRDRLHSLNVKKQAVYVNIVRETAEGRNEKKEVVSFHPSHQRDTRDFNYLNLWAHKEPHPPM